MPSLDQATLRRRVTGLVGVDESLASPGYTLIAPQTADGQVFLVDLQGQVVHRWTMPQRPGRAAVILPNGNLGYNGNHPDSPNIYPAWSMWHGGAFSEVTPEGEVVWQHTDLTHHHDAEWQPNGNLLYGCCEKMPAHIAARVLGGHHTHDLPDGAIYGDVIREVDRAGTLVWEWKVWEHLAPEDFPIHAGFDRYHWPMINGVSARRDGSVLLSLRTTSGVIAVDRASGDVIWHLGHEVLAQQHAPVELPNGNILIFDNGNLRIGAAIPYSRVIEVEPATKKIVWSYEDPVRPCFFSPFMGGAQRLPNGNTLICESTFGRVFEVTRAGETVWEYVVPWFAPYPEIEASSYVPGPQNTLFRAYRYTAEELPWLKLL